MLRLLLISLITFMFFGFNAVIADEMDAEHERVKSTNKGINGVINLLTFPLEYPMQCYKGKERGVAELEENPWLSGTCGGIWGLVVTGTRCGAGRAWLGIYETVGFWTLNPATNIDSGSTFDARYSYDFAMPERPPMGEAFQLSLNKGKRGLGNLLWGVTLELPTQVYEGYKFKTPGRGLVRGVWHMVSRVMSGVYETAGFFLPSTDDTTGYAFDDDEPWKNFFSTKGKTEVSSKW